MLSKLKSTEVAVELGYITIRHKVDQQHFLEYIQWSWLEDRKFKSSNYHKGDLQWTVDPWKVDIKHLV